jgi:hypothetical protein
VVANFKQSPPPPFKKRGTKGLQQIQMNQPKLDAGITGLLFVV